MPLLASTSIDEELWEVLGVSLVLRDEDRCQHNEVFFFDPVFLALGYQELFPICLFHLVLAAAFPLLLLLLEHDAVF